MKLITLTCPKCGAQMEVNPELEANLAVVIFELF